MHKAITFLGPTNYKPVTYVYAGQAVKSRFFPETLPRFFPDLDQVLVFVTPTVRRHPNLNALKKRIGEPLRPVSIPEGHSEEELWQIFDALTGAVAEDDTVIFDITHSFRSIPLLVFLAAAYLRTVRQVHVDHVIYGAFEARDEVTGRTPVFDLTPFVTLLDWLAATDRFVEIGDGRPLAGLLRERMPPGPAMGRDLEARAQGKQLKYAAQAIEDVSLALSVTRPLETMETASQLEESLRQADDAVEARARPFTLLTDRVRDAYAPFACTDPLDEAHWHANLRRQLAMVRWYLDKEQIVQAATLAREWVVSLVACYVGTDSLVDYDDVRGPVAGALNNACRRAAGKPITRPTAFDDAVAALPVVDNVAATWSRLTDLRNDLAHVGMNDDPQSAARLGRAMEALYPALDELASVLLTNDNEDRR
jgi:CRISPR-associated Csx2 family protein